MLNKKRIIKKQHNLRLLLSVFKLHLIDFKMDLKCEEQWGNVCIPWNQLHLCGFLPSAQRQNGRESICGGHQQQRSKNLQLLPAERPNRQGLGRWRGYMGPQNDKVRTCQQPVSSAWSQPAFMAPPMASSLSINVICSAAAALLRHGAGAGWIR